MKKSRVGILSYAHIHAHAYAEALRRFGHRAEVVGIYHEEEETGRKYAARFPGASFFADYADLLDQNLDGVVICSANADHCGHVTAASKKVPYILCEKPLATTMADARAMVDACREHGARLMIAYPCRYAPAATRARDRIRNGDLGNIIGACGTNRGTMHGSWFVDQVRSGGGAVMDHTVHVADLWRWMLGFEVKTVYAETATSLHPIEVEDCALLSVTFDSGAIGTLDASWSRPTSFPIWGDVIIQFVGEKGLLEMDLFCQNLAFYSNDAGKMVYMPYGDDTNLLMIQDFLSRIETGGESPITGEDGLRSLEVALAAYESVRTGEPVELPL